MCVYCHSQIQDTFEIIACAGVSCQKDQDRLSTRKPAHFMFPISKTCIAFPISNQALQISYLSNLLIVFWFFFLKNMCVFNLSLVYQVSAGVHIFFKKEKFIVELLV